MIQPSFVKNSEGRVIELESYFNLFPGRENSFRIMFGGKILELMDEISGSLANLYIASLDLQAVHVGEEVLFLEPIRSSEAGKVNAKIVLVTDKIICVYVEVWGGSHHEPDKFTRRYAGFGLCAVVNNEGQMVVNLPAYRDTSDISKQAEEVITFQKNLRKSILRA